MWDKFKKKIKDIFTEEIEVEVEEEVEVNPKHFHTGDNQQVRTRVMYQYPERNSFRFPMIPDEPVKKRKQEQDIPAYQKKQRSEKKQQRFVADSVDYNSKKKQNEQIEKKVDRETNKTNRTRKTYQDLNNQNKKVYKKDPNVPFKPTDVPSPIYGFQSRHVTDELTDIPAYQRKEQRQEDELIQSESQVISTLSNEVETDQLEHSISSLQSVPSDKGTEQERRFIPDQRTSYEETAAVTEIPVPNSEDQPLGTERRKEREKRSKINPINSQENKRIFEKKRNDSKVEPFNVMMTPRDKKNHYERQKNNEFQKQQSETKKLTEKQIPNNDRVQKLSDVKTQEEQHQSSQLNLEQQQVHVPQQQQTKIIEPRQTIYAPNHLLNDPVPKNNEDQIWVNEQQKLLEQTLKYFNVRAKVVKATQGPSVTRFEVQPELGVKVSKIKNLSDDLKLNMAARDIRIEAPIPGKNTVGIEVPNLKAEMVGLQTIFETADFKDSKSPLSIALGLTIEGHPKITNIQKMPHGLIAGATGSGKSVCINTILISLIYKASHEDVKFLLIDPKMVELAPYNGIPHLVAPVITNVKAATQSLKWAVNEMEERYEKFVHEGVRDIERYNQKVIKQGRVSEKMPFIIIVIDELADLMMMSPQDVEESISRIAQKARACGIHLLLATQRPSVDVITGLIKANIPTRIAFSVSSQVDSRTIIDSSGAEKLLGRGDMLFVENGAGKSVRLQGPFVSDEEIERVTSYARSIAEPNYLFEQEELLEQISMDEDEDELMEDAIQFVLNHNSASTSLLQRHFKIGYNRAARLIDTLEEKGIISGQNGSKAREILVTQSQLDEL